MKEYYTPLFIYNFISWARWIASKRVEEERTNVSLNILMAFLQVIQFILNEEVKSRRLDREYKSDVAYAILYIAKCCSTTDLVFPTKTQHYWGNVCKYQDTKPTTLFQ